MPVIVQDNRSVKITSTALAQNTLLFSSLNGTERLSRLFSYTVEVVSEDWAIELNSLTGTGITIELELPLEGHRYFHGFIAQCSQIESSNRYARYELIVRPWLWFLTRTADCRIFQEMSVPEIIQEIFDGEGFTDYEVSLTSSYDPWIYCVQYRETDFNFVSRLMEQEGIYYYFKHENGAHKLILSDSYSAHDSVENYAEIPYSPDTSNQYRDRDHISHWEVHQNLQPGAYVTEDFNFESPKADLVVKELAPGKHAMADFEIYDYPGEFPTRSSGDTVAKCRMEEIQAQQNIVVGSGTVQGINAGNIFTLTGLDREEGIEYLITESSCNLQFDNFDTGDSATGLKFQCHFSAIPSQQPFRAPRTTPKPLVQGPQTAIVAGPAGEEIWTDEFGRVKLQFHWDRYGHSNETSSCWIRVSQIWAGQGWGAMHIPRIGQEVIVEFLDGDPDRPIITGRVYNGDNGVPYDLPANATQSGIKSRSTKSGSTANFNEIRMEDKKGSEEVYIHAEKNQTNIVENDEYTGVGHDRHEEIGNDESNSIGRDQTETVGNNKNLSVGANHTETVAANFDLAVGASKSESVGASSSETVAISKSLSVGAICQISVGGAMNTTVGGALSEQVGGLKSEVVGASKSVSIAGTLSQDIAGSASSSVGGNVSGLVGGKQGIEVKLEHSLKAKKILLEAEEEVVIKAGKSQISMKSNGDIEISGANVSVKGSKKIDVKASKDVTIKGSKIKQN